MLCVKQIEKPVLVNSGEAQRGSRVIRWHWRASGASSSTA